MIFFPRRFISDFSSGSVAKNSLANAGNRIQSLIQEDPTWYRATKPQLLSPSSRAWGSMTAEACVPTVRALQQDKPYS